MLGNRDLELMRTQQVEAMPDTVTIEERVLASDGFGGFNETSRVVIASGVPARITPMSLLEGLGQLGRPVDVNSYIVRVPRTTPVAEEQFLIRESDGVEMQINRVKSPRSWETVLTLETEVIK